MYTVVVLSVSVLATALATALAPSSTPERTPGPPADSRPSAAARDTVECDVIIAGGSTAALAAALHAAREGATTCLIEPTDWPGGQLTSEGVSAIDFAWHRAGDLDVGAAARDPANQPHELARILRELGSPGRCWVSAYCFEPRAILERHILPALAAERSLRVFPNSVVKQVDVDERGDFRAVATVTAIQRTPHLGDGYDAPLSADLADWYSAHSSARFTKLLRTFVGRGRRPPAVIDASPFGDVLALAGAPYLQGLDASDGGTETAYDRCGMGIVFPFVIEYGTVAAPDFSLETQLALDEAALPGEGGASFGLGEYGWDRVWTYRRIRAAGPGPSPGDLSLQNWNLGNDYLGGYVFTSRAVTNEQAWRDWRGGVDVAVLAAAERRALEWYRWYVAQAPDSLRPRLRLARGVLGTGTGLSKLPYVRDGRRSIGLGGFVLPGAALTGSDTQVVATVFPDRVAIGAYPFDLRVLEGCPAPLSPAAATRPYFIPFRALTNRDVGNLLVAGRTMAQSTLANAATRVHPTEWTTGIAAGVAAAYMRRHALTSAQALGRVAEIQRRIERYAPLVWTVGGRTLPPPNDAR
jgi:hypothetical protein